MEQRTFPYVRLLPYSTLADDPLGHLAHIHSNLQVARAGGDLDGVFGSTSGQFFHLWTRELTHWLKLKAHLPLATRVALIRLYFEVLCDATDLSCVERCASVLVKLAGPPGFLQRHKVSLDLDFAKLAAITHKIMPSNSYRSCFPELMFKCIPHIAQIAAKLQILDSDFEPHFDALLPEITGPPNYIGDLSMASLFILFTQLPVDQLGYYQQALPRLFYLWTLAPVGALFPLLSYAAERCLKAPQAPRGSHGIFDEAQMRRIISAAHRLLKNPAAAKVPGLNHRGYAASTIVYSLTASEACPVLEMLGTLVKSVEPHSHPLARSDQAQFLAFFVDLVNAFTQRVVLEREERPSDAVPLERRLNDAVCTRFAAFMLDGLLYGLYSKSRSSVASAVTALMKLSYLSPDLVLPRLLAEIYPSLRGFYTPHRALSCLGLLSALVPVLVRHPQFAFHLTSLLELVVPNIDANDPARAILALKIVQVAAQCVPFAPLSESPELAMEHVAAIVNGMEQPGFEYPEYTPADALLVLASSTANFDTIVNGLYDQTLLLLENLPERANEIRGSPESDLSYYAPFAMGCMLHALPAPMLERLCDRLIERVTSPLHTSADAVAQLCSKLVLAYPAGFAKLLRVLGTAIRNEVLENGAGVARSFGYRDRNFVWYQSILNMVVSMGGHLVMGHRSELADLAMFLRTHTRGESVFHVSYFVHHIIQTLVSTFCIDYRTFVGEPTVADWGRDVDLDALALEWHLPTEEEIVFALDLYQQHTELSMANVRAALAGDGPTFSSPTEFSDYMALNLTYVRTLSGAVSSLVDPLHGVDLGGPYIDDEGDLSSAVLCKFRVASGRGADPGAAPGATGANYERVHAHRAAVGRFLLETLRALQAAHEHDVTALKALLFAIKVWTYDVGLEKTARLDHAVKSVYASEKRTYKLEGLRKKLYPRPMLARRAQLYQYQRSSVGSRPLTALDAELLQALTGSVMSELPDIRFHAQCAVYSAVKAMPKSRRLVLRGVLDATAQALRAGEYGRAESGLQLLAFRSMPNVVKRQFQVLVPFAQVVFEAMASDHHKLVHVAYQIGQQVLDDVRIPCDTGIAQELHEKAGIESEAAAMLTVKKQLRASALHEIQQLVHLINTRQDSHWRHQMVATLAMHGIVQSPQVPLSGASLFLLATNSTSANPRVKRVAMSVLIKALDQVFYRSLTGASPQKYRLAFDESSLESGKLVSSQELLAEMANVDAPNWFYDHQLTTFSVFAHAPHNHKGWLVWRGIKVQLPGFRGTLDAHDERELREFGGRLSVDWLVDFIQKLAVEPRPDENHFEIMHGVIFKLLFQLCDLGLTAFSWADVAAAATHGDFDDLNWQRVMAEASYGLALVQKVASPANAPDITKISLDIQANVMGNQFSPEAVNHWNGFLFASTTSVDLRRVWPLVRELDALRIDADSSTKDSVRIGLRSSLVLSHAWKYRVSNELVLNLCENLGHPLESMRAEVAKQLAFILQTRPYHLSPTAEFGQQPHQDQQLIETCFSLASDGLMLSVDKARAFCMFIETLALRKLSKPLVTAMLARVPLLVQLSNVRDDMLVAQLNCTFEALGSMRFEPDALAQVVDMFKSTLPGATWHQRIRLLLFLQSVYTGNFIEFDESALDAVLELLFDPQVEVRELAADLVCDWTLCTAPRKRQQLVAGLELKFSRLLRDPSRRHGAALGLGALVVAHPYEMPLPVWVPRVLSMLAPHSSSVGIVGKSVKKILGDFKRTRQDSWHIDQKQFSAEELESLEGVLFKNYFV